MSYELNLDMNVLEHVIIYIKLRHEYEEIAKSKKVAKAKGLDGYKWWLQHIILMPKGWSRVIIKKKLCLHHHEVIKGFCRKIYLSAISHI